MSKFCNNCKTEKPLKEWAKNKTSCDGYGSQCKTCVNSYCKEYYKRTRETQLTYAKKKRKENPILEKWYKLRKHYDFKTKEEYISLFEHQNNKCKICDIGVKPFSRNGHVDHKPGTGWDWRTGKHTGVKAVVRGILCKHCNTAIGLLQDSPDLCVKARDYLLTVDTVTTDL